VSGVTREAEASDLGWVVPAAVRSHVVEDAAELIGIHESEPWRVRVTQRGEAVLLDRWRTAGGDCAVLGLWCAPRRVPVLIADLMEVARGRGFVRLVGPLVPEAAASPYLDGGMRVIERLVVMRLDGVRRARVPTPVPFGVEVRLAAPADLPAISRMDAESFDPFWHYDMRILGRLARIDRIAVAVRDGAAIGYTLATARGSVGSLGRLAVAPTSRRRGVGRLLAGEAVAWMADQGARTVVLSTQEGNAASRTLYRQLGFRELPGALVATAVPLSAAGEGRVTCRDAG
jgi:ribosomal protein S18 acetylase RimI-like enzyme